MKLLILAGLIIAGLILLTKDLLVDGIMSVDQSGGITARTVVIDSGC